MFRLEGNLSSKGLVFNMTIAAQYASRPLFGGIFHTVVAMQHAIA
jgi:hypothetical protein